MGSKRTSLTANLSPIHDKMSAENATSAASKILNFNPPTAEQLASGPEWARALFELLGPLIVFAQQQQTKADPIDVYEEQRRLHSVVIAKLPESTGTKPSDRLKDDMAKVEEILDICDMEFQPTAVYRMGQKNPKMPRLLKVELPTTKAVSFLLKSSKNSLKNTNFQNVQIRASLTQAQRLHFQSITSKCREARAKTNADFIVYRDVIIRRDLITNAFRAFLYSRPTFVSDYNMTPIDSDDFASFFTNK
jgi:hypothetical protein